jgi:8-oxo-dGTP diphosphatase
MALELDFAVLGAVHSTASHPGVPVLGWEGFTKIVEDPALPVYAIGGLSPRDLHRAWEAGAHGLSLLSAAWA